MPEHIATLPNFLAQFSMKRCKVSLEEWSSNITNMYKWLCFIWAPSAQCRRKDSLVYTANNQLVAFPSKCAQQSQVKVSDPVATVHVAGLLWGEYTSEEVEDRHLDALGNIHNWNYLYCKEDVLTRWTSQMQKMKMWHSAAMLVCATRLPSELIQKGRNQVFNHKDFIWCIGWSPRWLVVG